MEHLSQRLLKHIATVPLLENNRLVLAKTVVGVLRSLQSWPNGNSPFKSNIHYGLVFLYCNVVIVGIWGHIIKMYISPKFAYNAIAVDLAIMSLGTTGYQYCTYLYRKRHLAKELLREMGDFQVFEKPPGIELADAILNAVFQSIIIVLFIVSFPLMAYMLWETCPKDDYDCGLIYPAYIPGLMTSFLRKFVLILQVTSACIYALLGTGSLYVGIHMAEYLVLYLRHCQSITKQISHFSDFYERKKLAINAVRYHHRIIFLYGTYQEIASGLFLVHAVTTPAVLAMLVYTFLVDFRIPCFFLFVILTMTLFVICFMGQRLMNESEILADIVYEAIPLDGDLETGKILLFMLVRTQRPLMIPAGSITHCGFELFLNAMKSTYYFLGVIQQTS